MATLLLNRSDVADLLPIRDCIQVVEQALGDLGEGRTEPSASLASATTGGGFHVKAGQWNGYFAAKTNGNFPGNPSANGLPTIQGVVLLCDATNGSVLAIMDSIELTARRTAAASAIAARMLARGDARVLTIVGCGVQAAAQLDAMRAVMSFERVLVYDSDYQRAISFAKRVSAEAEKDLAHATRASDVIVTCTTSKEFLLHPEHVKAGAFIAAVGVDNPVKKEIAPELMQRAVVITDSTTQCAHIGDLHHAIVAGVMTADRVRGELPAMIAGKALRRESDGEIIIFDSTGIGLQDVAAAARAFENAQEAERGFREIDFA